MKLSLQRAGRRAVIDTMGGELVSYRDEADTEYIWQGDSASWTGHNPLLFPIVGALKDGTVRAGDKLCRMPQHGVARRREFTVTAQGEDFAVLSLCDSADTLAAYPFPFRLDVRQTLVPDGFSTAVTVTNPGAEPMPFCVGAHTAFNCPLHADTAFSDYEIIFDQVEDSPALLPTRQGLLSVGNTMPCLNHSDTIPLDYAVFDRVDTLAFDGLRSHGVRLRHKGTGCGVHMDFSGFPMLALWTKPGCQAPFLCIEPWQGCAAYEDEGGDFAEKPYAVLLAPGAQRTWRYTVTTL